MLEGAGPTGAHSMTDAAGEEIRASSVLPADRRPIELVTADGLRLVGEDARYVERPGRTSPPYPGHGMVAGQRLRGQFTSGG